MERVEIWLDALARLLAWWMPKRVAYWCAVRVGAEATRIAPSQVVGELTVLDALRVWRK